MSGQVSVINGLSRRSLLLGSLALPILAKGVVASQSLLNGQVPALLVVITGIDPTTTPGRLASAVEPFMKAGISAVLSVNPLASNGTLLSPRDVISKSLRDNLDRFPNQLELALDIPEIATASPYEQLRQTSINQAALTKAINPLGNCYLQPLVMAATLTTRTPVRSLEDLSALRAAGIRTVIHLAELTNGEGQVSRGYWTTSTGLAKTFAVNRTSSPHPPAEIAAAVELESRTPEPIVATLSLADFEPNGTVELSSYATLLARHLASVQASHAVRPILPYSLYTQSTSGPARYIIVRVDDFRLSKAADTIHKKFVAEVLSRGIPLSQAVIPGGVIPLADDLGNQQYLRELARNPNYDFAPHGKMHTLNELLGQSDNFNKEVIRYGLSAMQEIFANRPLSYIPPNNAHDAATLKAYGQYGGALFSSKHGTFDWFWGLDEFGILHASHSIGPEKGWSGDIDYYELTDMERIIGSRNDAVLMLHPQTMNSDRKWRVVIETLEMLSRQYKTKLTNFRDYYDAVMPRIAALERIQTARYEVGVVDHPGDEKAQPDQDQLIKDAAVAWQYFDRWQGKYKGLVPATTWLEGDRLQGYPFATMWDVASMIMGNITAWRLGFISQSQFDASIAQILRFVDTARYRRRSSTLPATEHPLEGTGGARGGFDSADTGRLLVALKVLDQVTNQAFKISTIVSSWDLDASIIDGRMHDLIGRKATSVHENSYAQYAARGYELWGYSIAPVFAEAEPLASMDATLRLVGELQQRGRIATEPFTTEQIEVGQSDHGTVAADLLHAAQIARFRATGILTCISEGPTDRAPWFTYQGYQMDAEGGSWEIDLPPGARHLSNEEREELRTISMKGCFLWLATRPGLYSKKLYDFARVAGLTKGYGFASGVFESTGKPTYHADVNTNGIILETLLYIREGSQPLINLRPL